jgi:hypothetical protein
MDEVRTVHSLLPMLQETRTATPQLMRDQVIVGILRPEKPVSQA